MCWSLNYQVMDSPIEGYWISRALTSSLTDWLIICCHYWEWWKLESWFLEEVCCWECDCVGCVWSENSSSSFLLPGYHKRANFGSAPALAISSFTPPQKLWSWCITNWRWEAKQVYPTLGCFSQIFCHSDETLPNMLPFPVHKDVCNQFYGLVCFPLHNLHPHSSCFSLSGFLPVSRSWIFYLIEMLFVAYFPGMWCF